MRGQPTLQHGCPCGILYHRERVRTTVGERVNSILCVLDGFYPISNFLVICVEIAGAPFVCSSLIILPCLLAKSLKK